MVTWSLQDPATTVVVVPGRPLSLIVVAVPFAQSTSTVMPGRAPTPWRWPDAAQAAGNAGSTSTRPGRDCTSISTMADGAPMLASIWNTDEVSLSWYMSNMLIALPLLLSTEGLRPLSSSW